jgi:ABC-type proline/glycine betaine transport system ATPase subunit
MIDTENLARKFGNLVAEDLTWHVEEGEVFGSLGPNGAGKTTTVTMLSCPISKTSSSARVNDVRAANQFGGLLVIPFGALYVLGEINFVPLAAKNLLIPSVVLLFVDVLLFFLSRATFRGEEILTKWK